MQQEGKPVLIEKFYCEGRGPESTRYHWAYDGQILRAIDYINPDEAEPKHLLFIGVQVFMRTPEEVIDYKNLSKSWYTFRSAGILCFGKSLWLVFFLLDILKYVRITKLCSMMNCWT